MAKVLLGMNISLDGYINDRDGSVERLYLDLAALRETEVMREAIQTTGAVLMGRHAFAMGDPDSYAGNYEFQVPIFVVCKQAPARAPMQTQDLTFTFVTTGIADAIEQARAAAGNRYVSIIGGASVARQCLEAGLVDELQLGFVPALLGGGLRLFGGPGAREMRLEKLSVRDAAGATYIRYRILKDS